MTTVEQLHGSNNSHNVEKGRFGNQKNERVEKDWTDNMEKLNQVLFLHCSGSKTIYIENLVIVLTRDAYLII